MIFLPIVICPESVEPPYVNEWEMKVFVDVEAHMENLRWSKAWNYMDPEPTTTELNPLWYFEPIDGWLIDYVNYMTFEGELVYHWWQIKNDGVEECFPSSRCYTEWEEDAVQIRSEIDDPDIDVIIVKIKPDPNYCPTCIPSKPPE